MQCLVLSIQATDVWAGGGVRGKQGVGLHEELLGEDTPGQDKEVECVKKTMERRVEIKVPDIQMETAWKYTDIFPQPQNMLFLFTMQLFYNNCYI